MGDDYPHKSDYFNRPGDKSGDDQGKDNDPVAQGSPAMSGDRSPGHSSNRPGRCVCGYGRVNARMVLDTTTATYCVPLTS